MLVQQLVRVGIFGHVGRFTSDEGVRYARGSKVVCRTARGLELGTVLADAETNAVEVDGTVIRRVTLQDELLQARLEQRREQAFQACARRLAEHERTAVLVDVEHLFDGRSLYFYFLGEVTPQLERLTEELAEVYDQEVQFRRFAETVIAGCGPLCGTEEAAGQGCGTGGSETGGSGTGGCASCAVAGACGTTRAAGSPHTSH